MDSSPIDWGNVLGNLLWILGCAVALATLSYQSWQASRRRAKYSAMLKQPGAQCAMDLAGLLFCLGLGVTSNSWVKYIIWGLFSAGFLYLAILAYQAMRREQQAKKD